MPLPSFDMPFLILALTVLIAGMARGLSGFGTGMIVAPVAGALYGPRAALVIIVIMDLLPTIPVTLPALRIALWREVLPILAGIALFVPAGVYLLKASDPTLLRIVISLAILTCAVALWSGWKYEGRRTLARSLAVGGLGGVLSGIAQIPGPPVIIYWLSSTLPAPIVRANLLSLFFLSTFLTAAVAWASGLFTREVVTIGVFATPVYFTGLLVGARFYGRLSDRRYRQLTLMLVVLSALLSMPWRAMLSTLGL